MFLNPYLFLLNERTVKTLCPESFNFVDTLRKTKSLKSAKLKQWRNLRCALYFRALPVK